MLKAREKYRGIMDIRIGMEVGIMAGQFEAANKAINAFPYDIIMGSFHCNREKDLYTYDFTASTVLQCSKTSMCTSMNV